MTAAGPRTLVLYIEDNPVNFRLVQLILEQRPGLHVLQAVRGAEGLALARERRPGLLLVDLHLPDMSGEDVVRAVVTDPDLREIPVVLLSAETEPAQVERILALGAQRYVMKPLDLQAFLSVIDECLPGGR